MKKIYMYIIIAVVLLGILAVGMSYFDVGSLSVLSGKASMEYPELTCSTDIQCENYFREYGVTEDEIAQIDSICLNEGYCMMRLK